MLICLVTLLLPSLTVNLMQRFANTCFSPPGICSSAFSKLYPRCGDGSKYCSKFFSVRISIECRLVGIIIFPASDSIRSTRVCKFCRVRRSLQMPSVSFVLHSVYLSISNRLYFLYPKTYQKAFPKYNNCF